VSNILSGISLHLSSSSPAGHKAHRAATAAAAAVLDVTGVTAVATPVNVIDNA